MEKGGVGEELQFVQNISFQIISQPTHSLPMLQCNIYCFVNLSYLHKVSVKDHHPTLGLAIWYHFHQLLQYISFEVFSGFLFFPGLWLREETLAEKFMIFFSFTCHFNTASSFWVLNFLKEGYSFWFRAGGSTVWPSWQTVMMPWQSWQPGSCGPRWS